MPVTIVVRNNERLAASATAPRNHLVGSSLVAMLSLALMANSNYNFNV